MAGDLSHDLPFDGKAWQEHLPEEPLLLSSCCVCGLIRDDGGSASASSRWLTLKEYRHAYYVQSKALLFTHTFCPGCLAQIRDRLRTLGHL